MSVRHCPRLALVTGAKHLIGLIRVAVDQRARIKRMGQRAHFMVKREEHFACINVDDILEPVLVLAALFRDKSACAQFVVRAGEVGDVDLDMMTVERRDLAAGFCKNEILSMANHDMGGDTAAGFQRCWRADDFLVESGNLLCTAQWHVEINVCDAKSYPSETFSGWMDAKPVSPRASDVDMALGSLEREFGFFEELFHRCQAAEQSIAVRHYDPDCAAHNVGFIGG